MWGASSFGKGGPSSNVQTLWRHTMLQLPMVRAVTNIDKQALSHGKCETNPTLCRVCELPLSHSICTVSHLDKLPPCVGPGNLYVPPSIRARLPHASSMRSPPSQRLSRLLPTRLHPQSHYTSSRFPSD